MHLPAIILKCLRAGKFLENSQSIRIDQSLVHALAFALSVHRWALQLLNLSLQL